MAIESLDPKASFASMSKTDGAIFVDVRTVEEFDAGHPEGAVNVPWAFRGAGGMQPNPKFDAEMEQQFGKDARLYLSCQAGGRSLKACHQLDAAGFSNLVNVDGGWGGRRDPSGTVQCAGWVDSGLPTASEKSTYTE